MAMRPPMKPRLPDEPLRHVIDEYKHRERSVICVCGWRGGSEGADGRPSEWAAHLAETRGPKR